MDPSLINRAVNHVDNSNHVVGIILHGSHVTGLADQDSDLDLLCLSSRGAQQRYSMILDSIEIDVRTDSIEHIRKLMYRDISNNNNVVLWELVYGDLVLDRNAGARELVAEARNLWARGPVEPSRVELEQIHAAVSKCESAFRRHIKRSQFRLELESLARMECDVLFRRVLDAYNRVFRVWGLSLKNLLAQTEFRHLLHADLCRSYLMAQSEAERLAVFNVLVDTVTSEIGRRLGH